MMATLAEVHTIYAANCRSIPDMLRQSADSIETERDEGYSPTTAMVAVQFTENGKIAVYGWGNTSTVHAVGLLQLGMQEIASIQLDTGED